MNRFDNTEEKQNPYILENELRKTIQRQKKTIFRLAERNRVWKIICAVLAALLVVESIALWGGSDENEPAQQTAQPQVQNQISEPAASYQADDARIDAIMSQMTLVDKINQMLMVTPEALTGFEAVTAAGESTELALANYKVGGILYNSSNFEDAVQTKQMLSNTIEYANTPLFMAVSDEGGSNSMLAKLKSEGSFTIPSQAVIGTYTDEAQIESDYRHNAAFMNEFGFNVNFAPYAPPVSSAQLTIENSFGSDVEKVSSSVSYAVKGQTSSGVISALKYFPTKDDSKKTGEQLRGCEFAAFKAGFDAGADFVLVSNGTNTNLTSDSLPYCMSKSVIGDLLIGELGFGGIVISNPSADADILQNYTLGEIAVNCINAGNNMIICSASIDEVVTAINEAVRIGEIEQSTIDNSVRKILRVKVKRGIIKS